MAAEDQLVKLLANLSQKANPDPTDLNSALQLFTAPIDRLALRDVLATSTYRRAARYGLARYADAGYQSRQDLTLSGNEITDAVRSLGVQGDGRLNDSSFGIWEATTNLCTNGGFETNTTNWNVNVVEAGLSITRDTTKAKFGSASCKVVTPGTVNGEGIYESGTDIAATGGTTYTTSVWVFAPAGATLTLGLATSGLGTVAATNFVGTGGWQRVTVSGACLGAGAQTLSPQVYTNGTQALTFNVDGVQVEQKSIATPYVHTDGATATRNAGRVQAPSSLLNATQGWVAMRVRTGWASSTPPGAAIDYLFDWRNDANNRISCYFIESGKQFALARFSAGAGDQSAAVATFAAGSILTLIFSWTASTLSVSINGAPFVSAASSHIPTMTATLADIGSSGGGATIDSDVLWAACGTGTLTDADAATINGFGNTCPTFSQFPSSALCTGIVLPVATPIVLTGP